MPAVDAAATPSVGRRRQTFTKAVSCIVLLSFPGFQRESLGHSLLTALELDPVGVRAFDECGHNVKARLGSAALSLGQHQVQWLAAHEPLELALGPGERLFHRFALQIANRHLCHDALCIYLPGNLGRRRSRGDG
jgi:hypothetical protein